MVEFCVTIFYMKEEDVNMAAIWVTRNSLIGNTGNLIGYKSGLGLTFDEFCDIMPLNFMEFGLAMKMIYLEFAQKNMKN